MGVMRGEAVAEECLGVAGVHHTLLLQAHDSAEQQHVGVLDEQQLPCVTTSG